MHFAYMPTVQKCFWIHPQFWWNCVWANISTTKLLLNKAEDSSMPQPLHSIHGCCKRRTMNGWDECRERWGL